MVVLCLVLGSSVMSNKGLGFESRAQRRPNWCFGVMITSNHTICSNLLRLYIYIYMKFYVLLLLVHVMV